MGGLSWWHWLIVIAALILLFGAKKLPDTARGLGRSLRILKSEVAAMHDDQNPTTASTPTSTTASTAGHASPATPVSPVVAATVPTIRAAS